MAISGNTRKITVEQANTLMQGLATKSDARFQHQEAGKGLSQENYTTTEKTKLSGIEAGANNYTLPDATTSGKGGVQVGANIEVDGGTISVKNGSTSDKGVVQLEDSYSSAATDKAATPAAVKAAYDLAGSKQSPATSLAGYGITDAYTKQQVDDAIAAAASSSYHAGGSLAASGLVAGLLVAANDSKVYNVSEEFTTTADFVEGAGKKHPAGTNIVVVNTAAAGETAAYKFDVLAGFVDLSDYATLEDVEAASAQYIQYIVDGIYNE